MAHKLSEESLTKVWDNDADDVFNQLAAMAKDPQTQRELRSIDTGFAAAESDGLSKQAEIGRDTFAA